MREAIVRLRSLLSAAGILRRHLGVWRLAGLLWELSLRGWRGDPWGALPTPASERERLSRKLCGEAVLLYDALAARLGADHALAVTGDVVRASAVLQLRTLVPRIDREAYAQMAEKDRKAVLQDVVRRFPNATPGEIEAGPAAFRFTVTRCEFRELMLRVERPQLAAVFCKGDEDYFGKHMPGVQFDRPATIADGASCCDFRFTWRGAPGSGDACGSEEGAAP